MLSGECRIEAIPVDGDALLLDGLRLRLDLRLRPASAPGATAVAAWVPALPPRVQKLAALAGLGSLLVALALWSWSGPSGSESAAPVVVSPVESTRAEPAPAERARSEAPPTLAPAPSGPPLVPAPVVPGSPVVAIVPPTSSGSASESPSGPSVPVVRRVAAPARPPEVKAALRTNRGAAPAPGSLAGARSVGRGDRGGQDGVAATVAPAPKSAANADLLELFGDTK